LHFIFDITDEKPIHKIEFNPNEVYLFVFSAPILEKKALIPGLFSGQFQWDTITLVEDL